MAIELELSFKEITSKTGNSVLSVRDMYIMIMGAPLKSQQTDVVPFDDDGSSVIESFNVQQY